jgi:putative uncharacterized protein (fragment)
MGVIDAPQWLLPAYVRSVRALGASAPVEDIGQSGRALIEMWSSPDRHFHNLKHAINMLARVDELADESHDPDMIRMATWYHGCIFSSASEQTYRRNGGEDEVASAAYAAGDLHKLGLPDATVDRICALILNLKHHSLPHNDIDALALNDADLGALAVEPQQYKRYRRMVREEYAHIPVEDYLRARLTIITRLLDREMLFSSPLGQRWERPARQNLQAEKQRLTDELARLRPDGADEADSAGRTDRSDGADSTGRADGAGINNANAPGSRASAGGSAPAQKPREAVSPAPRRTSGTTRDGQDQHVERTGGRNDPSDRGRRPPRTRSASGSPFPFPASASPRRSPTSASSPRTPAGGVDVADIPPSFPPRGRSRPISPISRGDDEDLGHTTSMESCAADLDRLLASRRLVIKGDQTVDRAALVEAERAKLAERLRLRTEAAKALRETRTGEIAPVTAPLVEDGAGDL